MRPRKKSPRTHMIKKGPLNRIDLRTEVPFKFSPGEAREILQSERGLVSYSRVRQDGRGWITFVGSFKEIFHRGEGQSTDLVSPPAPSDGDDLSSPHNDPPLPQCIQLARAFNCRQRVLDMP